MPLAPPSDDDETPSLPETLQRFSSNPSRLDPMLHMTIDQSPSDVAEPQTHVY